MKTMTAVKWIAALMLAAGLTVYAQGPGGGAGGGGGQGGQGGQRERPTPEQMAKHLMEKFDANKDGELTKDELTQALEALRAHHPQGGGQGGGSGGAAAGGKGGQHHAAAGGGGQQGGGQGGQAGEHKGPPSVDEAATKMIEKFSSDKKGLTEAELAKAIEEHQANRGQHGGGGQGGHGGQGGGSTTGVKTSL